jgi:predicted negative regulator of RcsB-dependent stress response
MEHTIGDYIFFAVTLLVLVFIFGLFVYADWQWYKTHKDWNKRHPKYKL